ncbi:DUF4148 domain-containing protein [Burkholderia gladioli]|uniref:DUF4148 domain-containing protein n=1 Tax=Burkholderia gladioli TaxID=28095 RepID=UPI0016401E95|nr:DUF4148 domain-containing protein [Burkholderia gladioli]
MNRLALIAAALVLSATAASAFADGGIGRAGSYGDLPAMHANTTQAPLTRAQVRAELAQAQRDGTLALLRKSTSYPQGIELAQQRAAHSESGAPSSELASANR